MQIVVLFWVRKFTHLHEKDNYMFDPDDSLVFVTTLLFSMDLLWEAINQPFLATFWIAKYFGNAGNWVFWLEFLQNPWVFGKFHWVFREFFKIYDKFCKILNTASIYVQFVGQIMPDFFCWAWVWVFFLEFLNSWVFSPWVFFGRRPKKRLF